MSQKNSTLGTAVVTGASSGIGKVYADRLAARGYDLLLVARRGDRLQTISQDLEQRHGIVAETLVADLSSADGQSATVQELSGDASITLLLNNAGFSHVGSLTGIPQETLDSMIALNIVAVTKLTIAALSAFGKRGSGTIINIGSGVGFAPISFVPVYGPTKAYVLNFTQVLQQQVAGTGVRVQLVAPAVTVSEGWDLVGIPMSTLDQATVMTTEDCVDAALRGLDAGELITVPTLEDKDIQSSFESSSATLLTTMMSTGKPASRYGLNR